MSHLRKALWPNPAELYSQPMFLDGMRKETIFAALADETAVVARTAAAATRKNRFTCPL
jgi:hypothetical protein